MLFIFLVITLKLRSLFFLNIYLLEIIHSLDIENNRTIHNKTTIKKNNNFYKDTKLREYLTNDLIKNI